MAGGKVAPVLRTDQALDRTAGGNHAPWPDTAADVVADAEAEAGVAEAGVAGALVDCLMGSGVDVVAGVPDSNLFDVAQAMESRLAVRWVPREDVAVAFAVGAWLAGRVPAVLMKNAGLGTSLDALLSLAKAAGADLTLVIGWAGTGPDRLAHHVVVGERTVELLLACDVEVDVVRRGERHTLRGLGERLSRSRAACRTHAVLVTP